PALHFSAHDPPSRRGINHLAASVDQRGKRGVDLEADRRAGPGWWRTEWKVRAEGEAGVEDEFVASGAGGEARGIVGERGVGGGAVRVGEERGAGGGVQAGGGRVEQERSGGAGERSREADALGLAAGEGPGGAVGDVLDAEARQCGRGDRAAGGARDAAVAE